MFTIILANFLKIDLQLKYIFLNVKSRNTLEFYVLLCSRVKNLYFEIFD